jgi:hypothetical protein
MQKADLDAIPPDVHGLISKQTAELDGVDVTRVRFDVGARWSNDLKDYAGTESCELPHVALVLSGRLHVVMSDGSERSSAATRSCSCHPATTPGPSATSPASSSSSPGATISTRSERAAGGRPGPGPGRPSYVFALVRG